MYQDPFKKTQLEGSFNNEQLIRPVQKAKVRIKGSNLPKGTMFPGAFDATGRPVNYAKFNRRKII